MLNKFVLFFLVSIVSACATPPTTYTFSNSRSYQKSYDQVWESLVAYFATNHLQIKNIDKASGLIYAESSNSLDKSFSDCGKEALDFLVVTDEQRSDYNVTVTSAGNATTVHVNIRTTANRHQIQLPDANGKLSDRNDHVVQCNSTGKLEESILNAAGL